MLSHELAELLFDKMKAISGRDVMSIPSNHEKIRTYHQLPNGFSTEFASASHLILLADHLDLNGIAFGTPIDNTWLKKGKQYRDFPRLLILSNGAKSLHQLVYIMFFRLITYQRQEN